MAYVAGEFDTGPIPEAKLFLSPARVADLVKGYGDKPHPSLASEHTRLHPEAEACSRVCRHLSNRLASTHTWLERAQQRWEEVLDLPQVFSAL
ncbi:hypothetical protein [Nonomuraea thailandensis]|uniref:hypothetical protein n=1 Tax=Nonomuraea thailandensis TaxID=1188745 RepID=UPI0020A39D6E|nr:hypothetical protein [Nonomuraea thailandensis]